MSESEKLEFEEPELSIVDVAANEDRPADGLPPDDKSLFADELQAADEPASADEEFIEHEQMLSIIESLLFSTDKPVSVATIRTLFRGTNVRSKDIRIGLEEIARDYVEARRGFTLEEINGGYQLRSKVENTTYLRRIAKVRPFKLSGPALEVMAIAAYKQPVSKHEIDEIRGVESGHLIRALMDRGLLSFNGKSETLPGKPMTYGTTRKFLETFGLRNIRELPTLHEIEQLMPEGIGEIEESDSLSDITDEMSQEAVATYSEGEEELQDIGASLRAIDTTSEFFEQEKIRERAKRDQERAQDLQERIMVGEAVDDKDRRWLERYLAADQTSQLVAERVPEQAIES